MQSGFTRNPRERTRSGQKIGWTAGKSSKRYQRGTTQSIHRHWRSSTKSGGVDSLTFARCSAALMRSSARALCPLSQFVCTCVEVDESAVWRSRNALCTSVSMTHSNVEEIDDGNLLVHWLQLVAVNEEAKSRCWIAFAMMTLCFEMAKRLFQCCNLTSLHCRLARNRAELTVTHPQTAMG